MAIVNNISTELYDVMLISVDTPILGISLLSDFIDSTTNETATRKFDKKFRYSVDGITYSDWLELTDENIQAIDIEPVDTFKVQYRYERAGTDTTGTLAFNSITLEGTYEAVTCGEGYKKSIFYDFFSCSSAEVLNWCLNVLEKIFKKGIIPKYVLRDRNANDYWEDKDFINFWKSITWFFGIIVIYARLFEDFDSNKTLLIEYLRSHDLFVCENASLTDLNYVLNNIYNQVRERGTNLIAFKKGEITDIDESDSSIDSSSDIADIMRVNGELLRMLCYNNDEFIFCFAEPEKIGWNIGNSSPLFEGTNLMFNCAKWYENLRGIEDLSKYPLINSQYLSLVDELEDSDDSSIDFQESEKEGILKISAVPDSIISGIGVTGNMSKPIVIDPSLDYEVTFFVKASVNSPISFGVTGYNESGMQLQFYDIVTLGLTNTFFENTELLYLDKYYFVRGIIYNSDKSQLSADNGLLEWGFGNNMRFQDDHKYIVPYVVLDNDTGGVSGDLYIYDIKVRPLKLDFNLGFLGIKYLLVNWLKNNSSKYCEDDVTRLMKEKLIPYNCFLFNIFI